MKTKIVLYYKNKKALNHTLYMNKNININDYIVF